MMSRKDYKAFAEMLRQYEIAYAKGDPNLHVRLINDIVDYFAADNPKFDRATFLKAAGFNA